ncbi:SafA/ExsA family spore coat assembly protein [Brevibacillus ginsengisoli]|uniref:SafA/ExsA family spore coat assembly protein n=1 Tax=Brevibacillus ginsengisoli TaxID=363854 RepID=UPI003CF1CA5C
MSRHLIAFFAAIAIAFSFAHSPASSQQTTDTYIVQPGDSLWIIAMKYQIGLEEIIQANPQIPNPDLIYPQQKVTVPMRTGMSQVEREVVRLVNVERQNRGLSALTINWEVSRVARYKSIDMRDKNYFDHTSPTYGTPFTMLQSFGVSFQAAGENIAAGQPTAQAVMNGWMNSPGHRQNILNPTYSQIGVGMAQGGSYGYYWSQMFIN